MTMLNLLTQVLAIFLPLQMDFKHSEFHTQARILYISTQDKKPLFHMA